jgi:ABC-2 type transport system permease protein
MRAGLTRRWPQAQRQGQAVSRGELPVARRPGQRVARQRTTGRAATELSALLMVAQRDVVKLLRDRPRLAVNLAFPVLLIAGLGGLLQATVGKVTGMNTITLAFTGVLAASLFQSAAAGMISIVEDRENDFSRELFIAPVARMTLLAGKVTGESAVAVGQGICIVIFAIAIGVRMNGWQLAGLAGAGLACCLLGAAFGLATIAVLPTQRSAMQIFQFLIIPQYVLSGVLVPLAGAPRLLGAIAWLMPMRYCVDLMRAAFYTGTAGYARVVAGGPALDIVVIAALTAMLTAAGAALFEYRERVR